jgi:hypothetical protein
MRGHSESSLHLLREDNGVDGIEDRRNEGLGCRDEMELYHRSSDRRLMLLLPVYDVGLSVEFTDLVVLNVSDGKCRSGIEEPYHILAVACASDSIAASPRHTGYLSTKIPPPPNICMIFRKTVSRSTRLDDPPRVRRGVLGRPLPGTSFEQ